MVAWKFFLDNLESIAFWASVLVGMAGLLALILVCLLWERVAPWYREFWAKLGVAFFRFLAAASAVASRAVPFTAGTPLTKQHWAATILIAVAGYLLWEATGAIGDHKHKLAKEKTADKYRQEIDTLAQDRDDAVEQYLSLGRIVSHLRTLVSEKFQRIRRTLLASTTSRGSLPETRDALAPVEQVSMILEKLASLLHFDASTAGGPHNQNFRVGLYAEENGHLAPLDAFDLNTRRHDPFSSYQQHKDRFRLDNGIDPSHAVRTVLEGRMLVVPDCANNPVFRYFHDRQPNYLKSLVAYPLFDFSPDGKTPVRAAWLVDTDVAGYFQEEDEEMIGICLNEFATRIALEYAIRELTS